MSRTPGFIDLREEMLDFGSLPRYLRVLAAAGMALIAAGVLLLLLRDYPGPMVPAGTVSGSRAEVALPIFLLILVLLLASWTCILVGAFQMHPWMGLSLLAVATFAHWITIRESFSGLRLEGVSFAGLWLYYLLRITVLRKPNPTRDLIVIGALLGFLYLWVLLVTVLSAASGSGVTAGYAVLVGAEITVIVPLLLPLLFLAGVDLAELGGQVGAWAVDRFADRWSSRAVLAVLIVAASALWIGYRLYDGYRFGRATVPAALTILGAIAMSRSFRRHPHLTHEPPFVLVLAMAALLFIVPAVAIIFAWTDLLPTTALGRFRVETAWMLVGPAAMLAALPGIVLARRRGRPLPETSLFMIVYGVWIAATIGNPAALSGGARVQPLVTIGQFDLAACTMALVGTAMLWSRRARPQVFLFLAELLIGLIAISGILTLYRNEFAFGDIYLLAQIALALAAAITGSVRAVRAVRSRRGGERVYGTFLLALVAGLIALIALMIAEIAGLVPARLALPPDILSVLVLATALLWDFLMSGGRFTNGDTPAFPRAGRVLLYLGYVSLVATLLLWSSSLRNVEKPLIDEGVITSMGLTTVGIPVFLFVSAAAGSRLWSLPDEEARPAGGV